MKKHLELLIIFGLLFSSSACVSVRDELFLQNMRTEGSPSQPPVHLTSADRASRSVYLSPHFSLGSGTLTSSLEHQFKGTIPDSLTEFQSQGLSWKFPRATFGIDLDFAASNNLALTGAVTASVGSGRQLNSFYGGLGLFSADSTTSVRFDFGVQYIDIRYRGATVVLRSVDGGPADTIYFLDRGKEFHLNFYFNFTLNSTKPTGLNWFLQLGLSPQNLTTFVPSRSTTQEPGFYTVTDLRAESNVFWLSATPGIYFSLPQDRRLLIGLRVLREISAESSNPGVVLIPMVQFDWRL